jgi:Spy/CpxP family protein refolding chaperone
MKNRVWLWMATFAVAGLLCAAPASAQWGGGNGNHDEGSGGGEMAGGMGGMADIGSALGLDDAQWKKFNELRRQYRKDTIRMKANIDVAEVELEELADTNDLDMKKISAKIKEIAGMQAELRTYRYKTLAKMRSFISAEQFDTFRWMAMKMGFNFAGDDKGHGHDMH